MPRKNIFILLLAIIIAIWNFILLLYIKSDTTYIVGHHQYGHIEPYIKPVSDKYQFSCQLSYVKGGDSDAYRIPNDTIAVRVALALLSSYYGNSVYEEKPYKVALFNDSVWVVETTLLPVNEDDYIDPKTGDVMLSLTVGGVGHVEIDKRNGKIYSCYHTK